MRKILIEKIPVKKPTPDEARLFKALVPLIQLAKRRCESAAAVFLEDLIDACVMECYFRDYMAERDLLFHEKVAAALENYDKGVREARQIEFLAHIHSTLNAPKHSIRNQLIRLAADSPDLLGIIKEEGRV